MKKGTDLDRTIERWRSMQAPIGDLLLAAAEELLNRGSTADAVPTLQGLAATPDPVFDEDCDFALELIRKVDACVRTRRADIVTASSKPCPVDDYGTGRNHVDGSRVSDVRRDRGSVVPSPRQRVAEPVRRQIGARSGELRSSSGRRADQRRERPPRVAPFGFTFGTGAVAAAVEASPDDPASALGRAQDTYADLGIDLSFRASVHRIASRTTATRS